MMASLVRFFATSIVLSLFGCAAGAPKALQLTENSLGSVQPDRLVISKSTSIHLVRYQSGADEPDAGELVALNAFLVAASAERGDEVRIERSGEDAEDKRTAILSGALTKKGLRTVIAVSTVPSGVLRLTINHYIATAHECPDWTKPPGNDLANTLPSDFGCATAANLAAMIADPRDLTRGREFEATGGDPAVAALQRYRIGKTTRLGGEGISSANGQNALNLPGPGGAP